ncbi:SDR family NAD(P)-dependent oxidoreductase [Prevotella sp. tf2-5]|uniref:SDR family NAD(P)-dependent oxidoreductase n=1 Tax=Prevotella sp. tf2-5 TaxID=1761889 RepID=UPI0008E2D1FA|nr:SDR family oxidoreductase [Prevotella sp. tf2-5]SFP02662.1 3-oxoacyl-[acyl-carrier protein] reductase [Prevotella sp. tf2-5]
MNTNQGKTVLITGCNRGIGLAFLDAFAESGATVLACVRSKDGEFVHHCDELSKKTGTEIVVFTADLSSEDSIKAFISELYKTKRKVDVLINNAGVVTKGILQMTTLQSIKDVFQINFFAQVQITQGVAKLMMRQKSGVIINMASIGGIDAYPAYTSYGCSKAAVIYFTKTMAQELAPYGIRVNAIAPSMVKTRMQEQMGEEANEEIMRRTALKRNAEPDEIAKLALFLASDDSSFITGQVYRIDGGLN